MERGGGDICISNGGKQLCLVLLIKHQEIAFLLCKKMLILLQCYTLISISYILKTPVSKLGSPPYLCMYLNLFHIKDTDCMVFYFYVMFYQIPMTTKRNLFYPCLPLQ